MRFLIDTNVLSELRKPKPEKRVVSWILQNEMACAISDLVIGEFSKGAYRIPDGKRRRAVLQWIVEVEEQFDGRILPIDRNTFKVWGELCGASEREAGRKLQVLDSLIAATALTHNLTIVTRNTADFPDAIPTFSPWD